MRQSKLTIKLCELDPTNSVVWYNKGIALKAKERYNEALRAYDKAIEFAPLKLDAWNNKGKLLTIREKYDEAIKAYSKAIDINPQDVVVLFK